MTKENGLITKYDFFEEVKEVVPPKLLPLFDRQDGASLIANQLPKAIKPEDVSSPTKMQRAWELCGLYFLNQSRFHEALPIFSGLYDQMLAYQKTKDSYVHKGMPLVYISDCHARLDHPVLAKRYLMLTACEDAIMGKGHIAPTTGVYPRMVWKYGFSHQEVTRYAKEIWILYQKCTKEALFPEWILQEIDQDWMTDYPSPREAMSFVPNLRYIRWLIKRLGSGDGKCLERLSHYLISSMPGCRALMRLRSSSTDYDIVGILEGLSLDFRGEIGRYFLCECKDWSIPANVTAISKFCHVIDSAKCKFGIIFSRNDISGKGKTTNAERELLKFFQSKDIIVIVISEKDLKRIANGVNFIALLRLKYEQIKLDLKKALE